MVKTVYQTDASGYYVGPTQADPSPLESGVYLIPRGAVETPPPEIPASKRAKWTGSEWLLEDIPEPSDDDSSEPVDPYIAALQSLREKVRSAYDAALSSFEWNGVIWDARDEAATHLRDILNNIANHGDLPRGKAAMALRDAGGQSHQMDIDQIKALGKAGLDHRDACMERRLELLDAIAAAENQADLDGIDPESGWPS